VRAFYFARLAHVLIIPEPRARERLMALWARNITLGAIGNCLTINNNYEDHLAAWVVATGSRHFSPYPSP